MKQINLWGDIALNQVDIGNIQPAKVAGLAAGRILLEETSCLPDEIDLPPKKPVQFLS